MKINFLYRENKMSTILAAITISSLLICGPQANIIKEDLTVKKPTNSSRQQKIQYKKVPTKWVKITKKSN